MSALKNRGFSLVEILIAVSIIGILAVSGLVIYSGLQKKARVSKRQSDLIAINRALEIYKTANGTYPKSVGVAGSGTSGFRSECAAGGTLTPENVVPDLVPNYIQQFPTDPQMALTTNNNCYVYRSDGTDYKIFLFRPEEMLWFDKPANFTTLNNKVLLDPVFYNNGTQCPSTSPISPNPWYTARSWAFYSPGARCW